MKLSENFEGFTVRQSQIGSNCQAKTFNKFLLKIHSQQQRKEKRLKEQQHHNTNIKKT